MATAFPGTIDAFTNPTASDDLDTSVGGRNHPEQHADLNDAIEAMQVILLPTHSSVIREDFLGGNTGVVNVLGSGSGAGGSNSGASGVAGHDGIHGLSTGTTNTGRAHAGINSGGSNTAQWIMGEGVVVCEWLIRLPNLSDGTETYTARVGLGDGNGEPTDGLFFRYTNGTNSGKWECVNRSNGVETATALDSGITIVANDWYRLRVEVNAGGTSVVYKIATNAGSLSTVQTITANIPTGATRALGPLCSINKSAGTTARFVEMDYLFAYKLFTTPR